MKNNIIINVKGNNIYVIKKLIKYNVEYIYLEEKNNYTKIKVNNDNYKKICKIFKKSDLVFVNEYGINGVKKYIKNNLIVIISIIISLLLLIYLTNITFEIEIISKNQTLVNNLYKELERYGIKKYSIKKNYNELSKVKKKILNNYEKNLEWIELKYNGTKLVVELTERVLYESSENNHIYNVIAKKDALITKIIVKKGVLKKEINDYVKKGDIIISSDIINNSNEVASTISADGIIYGEVWYNVITTVPYEYIEYYNTNKSFNTIYLIWFNHRIVLIGQYNIKNVLINKKVLFDKPYLSLKLINEKKEIYEYKINKISLEEAKNEAISRSIKAIQNKLNRDEYIIDKKVLKINNFSSKISVEVFFRVYENIKELQMVE